MAGIDLRIDHCDRNVGCARAAEDVAHLELLQHVLPGIALHAIAREILPERVGVVGLTGHDDAVAGERPDGVGDALTAFNVQPMDRSVDAGEALRAEHGQLQARQTVVQRLLRRIARQLDHHLVLHEAGFFSRRQVEVAAGADVEPGRIVDARNGRRTRTGLRLLLLLLIERAAC